MTRIRFRSLQRATPVWALVFFAVLSLAGCSSGGGGGGGMKKSRATVTMSVQPGTIALGQTATLTWTASAGTTCTASSAWAGAQPPSGSTDVTPSATGTLTYTLSCAGTGYKGSTSRSATLSVIAPSAFSATSLVADTAGVGSLTVDANLLNAWGLAFGPTTFAWVANNHTETSTLYDGNGKAQPAASPLIVQLPDGAGAVSFDPTGLVYNGTADFVVTAGASSGAAKFIYDGEGGMIAGWSPAVDATHAVIVYTDAGGAIYKGLAIAGNGSGNFLYATDFHNNKIDVFDASFTRQTPTATSFAFQDPTLPAGYAPFGIQAVANGPGGTTQLYVSYAEQAGPNDPDNVNGAGLGLVNVFDANGVLVKHLLATGGRLDAPWGMALAPANFGTLSNALLIGNFGDGTITGYDAASGRYLGTVSDNAGQPFAVPGLWGIAFGNGANNQPRNTLFYAAGPNDEANGAYGRIDLGATPPALNQPPVVTLTAPAPGNVSAMVALTATATSGISIANVEFFLNGTTSLGVVTGPPYTVQWDTTKVTNGAATLTASATDVDGNVGGSSVLAITVANGVAATLTQIQADVFTPICSVCHNGSNPPGGALPGSQNLTAGSSFANLVNVASLEQPGLMRVKPGDPANSYLIRKLEGTAGITGARMPLGGAALSQATIDEVKSWIAAGAQNN